MFEQNLQSLAPNYTLECEEEVGDRQTICIYDNNMPTDLCIILSGVDGKGSFEQILLNGNVNNSDMAYFMVVAVCTARGDANMDTGKEISQKLLALNPEGSMSQDGLHYSFKNESGDLTIEIKSESFNV
ncbi:MAG: hypothetical protein ACOYBE_03990 [Blautia sp.]|jgi:hypothetical protein